MVSIHCDDIPLNSVHSIGLSEIIYYQDQPCADSDGAKPDQYPPH